MTILCSFKWYLFEIMSSCINIITKWQQGSQKNLQHLQIKGTCKLRNVKKKKRQKKNKKKTVTKKHATNWNGKNAKNKQREKKKTKTKQCENKRNKTNEKKIK